MPTTPHIAVQYGYWDYPRETNWVTFAVCSTQAHADELITITEAHGVKECSHRTQPTDAPVTVTTAPQAWFDAYVQKCRDETEEEFQRRTGLTW